MPLPFDGWKQYGRRAITAATAAGLLTDLADAASPSRIQMEADGWTFLWDADGFGVALFPPGMTDVAFIIAGKAASIGTPTMALVNNVTALDSATAAVLLVGMVFGGTFSSPTLDWDAASPLGTGTFTGFMRGIACGTNSHITINYSDDSLLINVDNATNGSSKGILMGGWIDPYSENAGDCRSDGKLLAMYASGSVATGGYASSMSGTSQIANSSVNNRWFDHGTADGNGHFLYVDPSTGYNQVASRIIAVIPGVHTALESANGRKYPLKVPVYGTLSGKQIGVTRDFGYGPSGQQGQAKNYDDGNPGGALAGYFVGSGLTSNQDTLFLQATENIS